MGYYSFKLLEYLIILLSSVNFFFFFCQKLNIAYHLNMMSMMIRTIQSTQIILEIYYTERHLLRTRFHIERLVNTRSKHHMYIII